MCDNHVTEGTDDHDYFNLGGIHFFFGTSSVAAEDELFAQCAQVKYFLLGGEQKDLDKLLSLTRDSIENAVESRLRSARLYNKAARQYLLVNITMMKPSTYGVNLRLKRWLPDLGYGRGGVVTVWTTGSIGAHGGRGQYLLGVVSKHLDKFLAEYLRVNEEACAKK